MKVFISIFLVGITLSCAAQDKKSHSLPMFSHSIGASFQQFDGLNSRVANLPQFEQLKEHTATLGLGWLKERNRVISGGGATIGSSMSGDRDEKSSTIRYIGLNADLGYDVIKSERIMLYPFAGLGLQKYQAIFYKDNSSVAFNEVLQSTSVKNSISSVKFNNSFFVYRAGIGVALKSPKNPSHTIGIQAGYSGSFKDKAWRSSENQALGDAPKDKIGQIFVGLVLTGGGKSCCTK